MRMTVKPNITRRLFAGERDSMLLLPAVIVSVAISCVSIGHLVADAIQAEREAAISEARLQEQARAHRAAQQRLADAYRSGYMAGATYGSTCRRNPIKEI
jgi:cell division protein FtsL